MRRLLVFRSWRIPLFNLSSIALLLFATAAWVANHAEAATGKENIVATPLKDRGDAVPMGFKQIESSQSNVDFTIDWEPPQDVSILGINSTGSCGGVAIGDYDGDGRPDLFLTRPFGGNRLYRNLGDFRFQDVTERAGLNAELEHDAWGAGPGFVDIDNDGDLDLYVCSHRRANRLYINQGNGTFAERAREFGLDFSGASVTMAFADYDRDGDLDAYLATNWLVPANEAKEDDFETYWEFRNGRPRVSDKFSERFDVLRLPLGKIKVIQSAQLDHFYRNDNGKFVEATREVLGDYSAAENSHGLATRWFDYDADGFPDLYVSNDYYGADELFHNNGDGTMTDVAKTALPHTPWYSMGSDAADVNNDGRMDFMGADMAYTTHEKYHNSRGRVPDEAGFVEMSNPRQQVLNALYINTGTDRFVEAAALAGVSSTDWTWALKFGDLDDDGRTDLYATNGVPRNWTDSDAPAQISAAGAANKQFAEKWESFWKRQPPLKEKNVAYRNLGDLKFEPVAAKWGLDFAGVSFGSALGDLDGDGDLDIVTVNFEDEAHIYRNEGGGNHCVSIKLIGTKSNRQAIGAVVTLETEDGQQTADLPSVRGFMSADEPTIHFGLGRHDVIQNLEIHWPSGAVQHFAKLPADRLYTITESAGESPIEPAQTQDGPMFVRRGDLPKIVHTEASFDDFDLQPLLPRRLSQLGPGIACADVNGDGLDDYYLAGAKGAVGQLFLGNGNGFTLDTRSESVFQTNQQSEEMAPLFFDADGDGDEDLYVVNGSIENMPIGAHAHDELFLDDKVEPDNESLQDRLYLNDGHGMFTPAGANTLPDMQFSGSVAVAADFDRDGDLDLFVGGRSVPGSYPLTPRSALLRNDAGTFVDVTDKVAPGLSKAGMVTSAIWSDADGDAWSDLLVTTEWGPVKLWRNDNGRLTDETRAAGLASRTGWWNGIAAGDLDHDGDMDYVVTNFGLNTRYHATEQHPAVVFSGDMDGDGTQDVIEAEFADGNLVAVRDKSSLTGAMPIFAEEWPTFAQFAKSTLVDLFGKDQLQSAQRLNANTLESGQLMNDGSGKFSFKSLPRLSQVAPAFAPAIVDVDADGNNDVYLVQNFFNSQREAARMDGGVSQLLLGDGKGGLLCVSPRESGLMVLGEAKAISVTDINQDARPDFLVTVNNGELMTFENRAASDNHVLAIRLVGRPGNPAAIGARVTLSLSDGSMQTAETQCGGGYLSESSSTLFFGLGDKLRAMRVAVRWPDGKRTDFSIDPNTKIIRLQQPES